MGILAIFSSPASKDLPSGPEEKPAAASPELDSNAVSSPPSFSTAAPVETAHDGPLASAETEAPAVRQSEESTKLPVPRARRISFRPFTPAPKHKPILSEVQEHEKKASATNAFTKRLAKPFSSNSDKRAKESALILRTLIVGHSSNDYATPTLTKAIARPKLSKVKSQLVQPNSANRVIAQLRSLPAMDGTADGQETGQCPSAPIHAVCLAHPDAEEHRLHFAKLTPDEHDGVSKTVPNVASASLDRLTSTFREMHIVDLITAPDLGIGQPGDGDGLLAGAVPTAETIITGIEQITPQLMALGYATGRSILPDHKGIHPPTDRMSVLTYWWGLEIVLPPPTLEYLDHTQSIAGTLVNFLTALALINLNGVREILPIVRYISSFIDWEWSAIKKQDQGKGVVCASTWIMPAALVPRPWDFPPPERASKKGGANLGNDPNRSSPGILSPPLFIPTSAPSGPLPLDTPLNTPSPPPATISPAPPAAPPSRISPLIVHSNSQTALSPAISLK